MSIQFNFRLASASQNIVSNITGLDLIGA